MISLTMNLLKKLIDSSPWKSSLAMHQYSETKESSGWKKQVFAKHIIIYQGEPKGNASLILALFFF